MVRLVTMAVELPFSAKIRIVTVDGRRDSRPDMAKTNMDGLLVCVPYNTLRLGRMESIKSRVIPSAVASSRRRLDRIGVGGNAGRCYRGPGGRHPGYDR